MTRVVVAQFTVPVRIEIFDEAEIDVLLKTENLIERDLDQSNGFYDYLRINPQTIVGVRWNPFTSAEFVLERVPKTQNITLEPNERSRSLYLWFGPQVDIKDEISDDQAFFYNRILEKESTGEVVMTFGLSNVSVVEIDLLRERLSLMKL